MGEDRDVTGRADDGPDHAVRPRRDLLRRFAPRAPVAEYEPTGSQRLDPGLGQALVRSVVPLRQVGIDDGHAPEAGELAGLARTHARAHEDARERSPGEQRAQASRLGTPALGQGDVGRPRVAPGKAPLRLAVSDRDDAHEAGESIRGTPRIKPAPRCPRLAGTLMAAWTPTNWSGTRTTAAWQMPAPEQVAGSKTQKASWCGSEDLPRPQAGCVFDDAEHHSTRHPRVGGRGPACVRCSMAPGPSPRRGI